MSLFNLQGLRLWLTLPFLAVVSSVALFIAALSYATGTKAVQTLSDHLLKEIVHRISQSISQHLATASEILNAAAPPGLEPAANLDIDVKQWHQRLWAASSVRSDIANYVYYGNSIGQFYGLKKLGTNSGEIRQKFKASEPRQFSKIDGVLGKPQSIVIEDRLYDPRTRPWFKAAEKSGRTIWTEVYVDFSSKALTITAAKRVPGTAEDSSAGNFGVVASDISLSSISDFLKSLTVSPNGIAFIVDQKGQLVASSHGLSLGADAQGKTVRVSPETSGHQIQLAAYQHLQKLGDKLQLGPQPNNYHFRLDDGDSIEIAVNRLELDGQLNWTIVVAAPTSDFIADVKQSVKNAMVIGLLGALLALAVGLIILNWISRDLGKLTEAVNAVGKGDLDTKVTIKRKDQIGQLANAFSLMQERLKTDQLTGLGNRDLLLKSIENRISRARQSEERKPFALLFIDLNNFKSINDRLGHEAGDKALVEIADRLRQCIRHTDIAARLAGDEFVVLLDNVSTLQDAELLRSQVEQRLAAPLGCLTTDASKQKGEFGELGGAVGLALFPASGQSSAELLRAADSDMYRRKSARRHEVETS